MTAAAASKYLGVQLRTLYRMIEFGVLPAHRMGRLIFFRTDEVQAFLEDDGVHRPLTADVGGSEPGPSA